MNAYMQSMQHGPSYGFPSPLFPYLPPHLQSYGPYEPLPLSAPRIVDREAQQFAGALAAAAQVASMMQQIDQQQRESNQQEGEADKKSEEQPQQPAAAAATCCVCMNKAPGVLYLPCKHYKVCERCDEQLERRDPCPVCRSPIEGRISQLHL
jgi:hypothetical protein